MTRVLIAGSRDYPLLGLVSEYVRTLPEGTTLLCGMARGVDRVAYDTIASLTGVEVEEYFPDWERYGKRAGIVRNMEMVEHADEVVCFWDGQSRGTKHTIDLALAKGCPVTVYGPDGQEM